MLRRPLIGTIVCALAVVAASACSSSSGTSASSSTSSSAGAGASSGAAGTFRVAGVLPLTGAFGAVGTTLLAGMNAQAELLNKQGGILGRQIQIDIKDSASDTQQAVSAMRNVLSDPSSVDAVVAEATGSLNAAVMPIVAPTKIIAVTSGSGQGAFYPTDFSFGSTPADESVASIQAIKSLHLTKVGLIGTDDNTGQADARDSAALASKSGLSIVGTELFDPNGKDYTAQLQKLRAAGAQVLTGNMKGTPIGVLGNGLADIGWTDVKVVGDVGWGSSPLSTLIPKSVQPQVTWAGALGGTRIDGKLSASQQQFIQAIKDTNGSLASLTASAVGADMITGLKYAFDKAGKIDQAAAVQAMEGMDNDPSAASLPWRFFLGQGPKFSAKVHDSSNIDPAIQFALDVIGEPVYGTYAGTKIS
jgi:ABC-type branched-subunit amino acid transport system substrate-binding protein